jgi:hypothetical protein
MRVVSSVLASALVFSWLSVASQASAQEASPTGKGVAGGALLGGELVLGVEAAFKVQSTWAYIGGGAAGAVAGGVGGYFVERDSSARAPMLMLAGGLVLAIPVTIAVLTATSYEPPSTYVQDQGPTDEPVAEPPQPTAPGAASPPPAVTPSSPTAPSPAATPPAAPAPVPAPTGPAPSGSRRPSRKAVVATRRLMPALIDVEPNRLSLSLPAVEVREVFTRAEVAMGAPQATEVRVPVLNVLF